ncbi:hypothetical protein AVEN_213972-1 [Araneus ventricosus]|uniref:ISXO2-like transposase domain-containing protein n=1 Tax=Araneus ventricosus TaxID=182803 RepID=A0A4Y2WCU7_ARAVE|nr:hypothetical protein AVEN_213972-1 [Araneus ventricosus]
MHFVDPDSGARTRSIERTWSAIKRGWNGTNHVKGQFDSYMAAFMWKRKNSTAEPQMEFLLDMIKEVYPPRSKDKRKLKKKKKREQSKIKTSPIRYSEKKFFN